MKVHDVVQGTPEWHALRAGRFTGSRVGALLAKGRGNAPSVTRKNLIRELACERMTGRLTETFKSDAMERGNVIEPEARNAYSFETGHEITQVGFCVMTDDLGLELKIGASPDGMIGTDGLVEIKCPAVHARHFDNLLSDDRPIEYVRQVQFQLLVTGRKWCDLVSYHPDFEPKHQLAIRRFERDEDMIAQFREQMEAAEEEIAELISALEKRAV